MTFEELKAMDDTYVMHTYARFPVDIDHGQGATLYSPVSYTHSPSPRDGLLSRMPSSA